eukprot:2128365-Pyramimonas_sp.AAC.1
MREASRILHGCYATPFSGLICHLRGSRGLAGGVESAGMYLGCPGPWNPRAPESLLGPPGNPATSHP